MILQHPDYGYHPYRNGGVWTTLIGVSSVGGYGHRAGMDFVGLWSLKDGRSEEWLRVYFEQ